MSSKRNQNIKDDAIHIAFGIDSNYVNQIMVTLYSLFKSNPQLKITAHILAPDLANEHKAAIDILKSMSREVDIVYYQMNQSDFDHMSITMGYITHVTYYRLMLADILPASIKKVLYIDADLLVTGDISPLLKEDLDGYYAAGVPDIYLDKDSSYKERVNMIGKVYINAGVLLFNLDKIRQDNLTKTFLKNATIKTHQYQDQDAINVTVAGHTCTLDNKYNYQIKDRQYQTVPEEDLVILHFSGSNKPWNRDRLYDAFSSVYDDYKLQCARFINERNPNVKYGLLKYSTDNVGDSIQAVAARKFLPRVDYHFERDNMDATKTNPGETVKVILNGWWGDGPENWPPLDQNLDLLPISMYVEDRIKEEFKKPRSKAFLNFFGPVGARSKGTQEFLNDIDVNSYFSGCLTLTLNPDPKIKRQDFILAVDVPDEVYEEMRKRTDRKIIRIGVLRKVTRDANEQLRLAEFYLYLYQSAHAVITTRLHTMMPCLALETPVLFINNILADDDVRFSGLAELAHNLRASDYIANTDKFDLNNPPKNKSDYLSIRKKLEDSVQSFTGYMSNSSYLSMPVTEMIFDANFIQSAIGGSSDTGDIREQKDKLEELLKQKENHVLELVSELQTITEEYERVTLSLSWKVTKSLRRAHALIKHFKK